MHDAPRPDAGRTVIEAVVALTLIAIVATAWAKMATAAIKVDDMANRRADALDVATSEIESLIARPFDSLAIDPTSAGAVRTFEGSPVILDPAGVAAITDRTLEDTTFTVRRTVVNPGSAIWKRVVVTVDWTTNLDTGSLRLEGASHAADLGAPRRPSPPRSPTPRRPSPPQSPTPRASRPLDHALSPAGTR
ncbi:MAG: hypothetical protein ACE5GB_15600, partial [Acidimicrobiales bacterium]